MFSPYLLILVFIYWPWGCNSLWTVTKSTAKTGTNITIPCHYHRMFKANFKYWCKGRSWALCTVVASTDPKWRRGGVSITDIPEELVFTVTMQNLRETDTNRYWCALKVGGFGKPDVRVSVELIITKTSPDLSVVDGRVSGEEGANVSIQCLYSDPLRDRAKWWCRSGDRHSCQTQTQIETSQNASVVIRDGKNGEFNVTFSNLERKDAGWYWCSVGDLQAPVHLNVIQRATMHGNISAVTTPRMLHSSFSSFETSTFTSTLKKTSHPSTVVSVLTSTSSYDSSSLYPAVSIRNIPIQYSISTALLSKTVQPKSTESNTTVIQQIYHHRNIPWHVPILIVLVLVLLGIFVLAAVNLWRTYSKMNVARSIEGEMAELVINQDEKYQ
ncbi:hypothetical protein UPYG_G00029180 [Umbra pygmaea]|uniref:Ig-like domain-containing protein n=1 Tax=Umbra pygmaea TaxID=75934 RepID=A0ABD0Y688_UMBPY